MKEAEILAECDCGNVTFGSEKPALIQLVCHCEDCRDASKDNFSVVAFFDVAKSFSEGTTVVQEYTAASGRSTTREVCSRCGTLIFDPFNDSPQLGDFVSLFDGNAIANGQIKEQLHRPGFRVVARG